LSAWVVVRINKSLYGTTRSLSANSEKLTEASEQVARTGKGRPNRRRPWRRPAPRWKNSMW
jgi:hypothetical protein